jgi:hypothetical protein
VQNRPGIRICISEKFVEIFNWYESDLEEVHQIYDAHKVMIKYVNLAKICPPCTVDHLFFASILFHVSTVLCLFANTKIRKSAF